jgi:1-phosphofructokinase family hexose kinase
LVNPAVDAIYHSPEFSLGTTHSRVESANYPAGKGINVARVIKELGEDVCVAGIIHEHNYAQFTQYLDRLGIASHLCVIPGVARINVTLLESAAKQTTHINSLQLPVPSSAADDILTYFRKHLKKGDFCICTGSLPPGISSDFYCDLIKVCSDAGAETLLDTSGEALRMGVRAKPLMVKPNLVELEDLFNEKVQGVHHIALKGKRLVDMGIRYAFVSLGSDGMIAIHENDCLLCSVPPVKAIDTVGCGDALVGGLVAAYTRNFSFNEMCRMAVASGTSKSLHAGPGIVTRDEVWQLMEEVTIKSV